MKILFKKWWAIAIQLPFLTLEILLIAFEKTEGLVWAITIQVLVSLLIVSLYKITNKPTTL